MTRTSVLESIQAVLPTNECVIYPGKVDKHGYGAHRKVYLALVGPIPPNYQIDHLCRVKACVNPAHLEAVTQQVNLFRQRVALFGRVKSKNGWPDVDGRVR